MNVLTTRFGEPEIVAVDERQIYSLAIVGFGEGRRFAWIVERENPALGWLQSLDDPSICFVVADPGYFFPDYEFDLSEEEVRALGLWSSDDAAVLVIVRVAADVRESTANLAAPLVLSRRSRRGRQIVLNDGRWSVRTPLLRPTASAVGV
jgi:flagellar assembly factor FliW